MSTRPRQDHGLQREAHPTAASDPRDAKRCSAINAVDGSAMGTRVPGRDGV